MESLKKKFDAFTSFSQGEQATAASSASDATLQSLADWNAQYETKFGHIFIICAAGKSANFMLNAVKTRYSNSPQEELLNAAIEQQKITEQRLLRVAGGAAGDGTPSSSSSSVGAADRRADTPLRSPITTHVLDTCIGKPAPQVAVRLERKAPGSSQAWETVATGRTNVDGRVPDLLPPSDYVNPGIYRISFDTDEYMSRCKAQHPTFFADVPFYPAASVQFQITPEQVRQHFHVPLTWNPYGYSTYRGS